MMERLILERVYLETETLGSLYWNGEIVAKTMELPWRNNKVSADSSEASCIPEGIHIVEKQEPNEKRPYGYFRFRAIEGRSINKFVKDKLGNFMSRCLWHRITFVKDLLGCIGIGGKFQDLNGDGVPDMIESAVTLEWLYQKLPDVFELEIKEKPKS